MLYTLQLGPLATNCYIMANEENQCVIIDAGGSFKKLKEFLDEKNLSCTDLILTHGHYDHIGAASAVKRAYPDCRVYINSDDSIIYDNYVKGQGLPAYLKKQDYEAFAPTDDLKNKDSLNAAGFEFKIIHTPGHTPGGVTLVCQRFMFTGDTLFKGSMGRVDLLGGSEEEIMKSLKRLYEYEGDYAVLPGHEGASTLSEERETNPYMKLAIK